MGLANLFFDQMGDQDWMPRGIRREFFDRYVIYDGKLISVELITAMLEDYARPRLMTEQERSGFLQEYFFYSGWIPFERDPDSHHHADADADVHPGFFGDPDIDTRKNENAYTIALLKAASPPPGTAA